MRRVLAALLLAVVTAACTDSGSDRPERFATPGVHLVVDAADVRPQSVNSLTMGRPTSIAVTGTGEQERWLIADTGRARVFSIEPATGVVESMRTSTYTLALAAAPSGATYMSSAGSAYRVHLAEIGPVQSDDLELLDETVRVAGTGGVGTPTVGFAATNTALASISDIAATDSNLYLAHANSDGQDDVLRVNLATGVLDRMLTTTYPSGIAHDANGDVLVADATNGTVVRVSGGTVSTVVPASTIVDGVTLLPFDVALLADGTLVVSDYTTGRVVFAPDTAQPVSVWLSDKGSYARSLSAAGDAVVIVDPVWSRVHRVRRDGTIETFGGSATEEADLRSPWGLGVADDGRLLVAAWGSDEVLAVDIEGGELELLAGGKYGVRDGPATAIGASLAGVKDVLGVDGRIYVTEGNLVSVIADGEIDAVPGYPGSSPAGLALAPNGSVYVTDVDARKVFALDPEGQWTHVAGSGTDADPLEGADARSSPLSYPRAVAVDSAGRLFIADDTVVRLVSTDGTMRTVAGSLGDRALGLHGTRARRASFGRVSDVVVDPRGGYYLVDAELAQVFHVDASGRIEPVAGGGQSFDDGVGLQDADLGLPLSLALPVDGGSAPAIFVADWDNERILRLSLPGTG